MAYIHYIYIKYGEDDKQTQTFSLGFRSSERTVSPLTDRRREEKARLLDAAQGKRSGHNRGMGRGPAWASTSSADPPPSAESCSPVSAARSRPQCHPGPAETAEAREDIRHEYSGPSSAAQVGASLPPARLQLINVNSLN